MKKTKTLRDLQWQKLSRQDILDLSGIDDKNVESRTKHVTGVISDAKKFLDISSKKSSQNKSENYRFVEVDEQTTKRPQSLTEAIKLAAAGTLILFLINVVNIYQRGMTLKNDVIATAYSGYENLLQAGSQSKQAQFEDAENSFSASAKNFDDALENLKFLGGEKTVDSAQNLLESGKNISEAGKDFSKGIQHLRDLPGLFLQNNSITNLKKTKAKPVDESTIIPRVSLTETLKQDLKFLEEASVKVTAASQNLAQVKDDLLPTELQPKLVKARDIVNTLQNILQQTEQKIPVFMKMLGDRYLHRYFVLLQNDAEARPTGGFIGSYLIVDVSAGRITNTEFHDVYESDGQLKEDIPAPEDIAAITKNWRMRDSNYSPDFAISAEKALWFLQKENGPSVDSVIAVNQSFIRQLFEITGPIQLEGLDAPLTQENYQTIISYLVETKNDGKEDPKKILRSFIPALFQQLATSDDLIKIVKLVTEALKNRTILLYSRDADVQNLFDELNFSGRVIRTKPNEDFLQIITTSVGGNKSDAYIQQSIRHNTIISNDGTVTDEVILQRKHTWTSAELKRWKAMLKTFGYNDLPENIANILGRGTNKSSLKIYVPEGAKLLGTEGIPMEEIKTREDQATQKTYFMFAQELEPGDEKYVTLSYQLPQKMQISSADTYRFFAQRQPGIVISSLEKNVITQGGVKILEFFPQDLVVTDHKMATQTSELLNDTYVATLVGPE